MWKAEKKKKNAEHTRRVKHTKQVENALLYNKRNFATPKRPRLNVVRKVYRRTENTRLFCTAENEKTAAPTKMQGLRSVWAWFLCSHPKNLSIALHNLCLFSKHSCHMKQLHTQKKIESGWKFQEVCYYCQVFLYKLNFQRPHRATAKQSALFELQNKTANCPAELTAVTWNSEANTKQKWQQWNFSPKRKYKDKNFSIL